MGSYSGCPECPKCGQKEGINTEDELFYKSDEYYFHCWECGYGYSRDTIDWKADPPKPLPQPEEHEWFGTVVPCPDCGTGMRHSTSWSGDMTKFLGYSYTCFPCRENIKVEPQDEPFDVEPPRIPETESGWAACEGRCGLWIRESGRDELGLNCGRCREDLE